MGNGELGKSSVDEVPPVIPSSPHTTSGEEVPPPPPPPSAISKISSPNPPLPHDVVDVLPSPPLSPPPTSEGTLLSVCESNDPPQSGSTEKAAAAIPDADSRGSKRRSREPSPSKKRTREVGAPDDSREYLHELLLSESGNEEFVSAVFRKKSDGSISRREEMSVAFAKEKYPKVYHLFKRNLIRAKFLRDHAEAAASGVAGSTSHQVGGDTSNEQVESRLIVKPKTVHFRPSQPTPSASPSAALAVPQPTPASTPSAALAVPQPTPASTPSAAVVVPQPTLASTPSTALVVPQPTPASTPSAASAAVSQFPSKRVKTMSKVKTKRKKGPLSHWHVKKRMRFTHGKAETSCGANDSNTCVFDALDIMGRLMGKPHFATMDAIELAEERFGDIHLTSRGLLWKHVHRLVTFLNMLMFEKHDNEFHVKGKSVLEIASCADDNLKGLADGLYFAFGSTHHVPPKGHCFIVEVKDGVRMVHDPVADVDYSTTRVPRVMTETSVGWVKNLKKLCPISFFDKPYTKKARDKRMKRIRKHEENTRRLREEEQEKKRTSEEKRQALLTQGEVFRATRPSRHSAEVAKCAMKGVI